jgi:hypothetical protein
MSRLVSIFRLAVLPLLATVTVGLAAPAASAATPTKLSSNLAALWTTVLQTPSTQNPFGTGGTAAPACWNLGGTVAPFAPFSVPSCTVKPGTMIFEVGSSNECSTFEEPTLTTEAELAACAKEGDVSSAPTVTVDGRPVLLTEVETGLMNIVLPADPVVPGNAGEKGMSVGHGWVALLNPLTPGTHTIIGTGTANFTTKIIVQASS